MDPLHCHVPGRAVCISSYQLRKRDRTRHEHVHGQILDTTDTLVIPTQRCPCVLLDRFMTTVLLDAAVAQPPKITLKKSLLIASHITLKKRIPENTIKNQHQRAWHCSTRKLLRPARNQKESKNNSELQSQPLAVSQRRWRPTDGSSTPCKSQGENELSVDQVKHVAILFLFLSSFRTFFHHVSNILFSLLLPTLKSFLPFPNFRFLPYQTANLLLLPPVYPSFFSDFLAFWATHHFGASGPPSCCCFKI